MFVSPEWTRWWLWCNVRFVRGRRPGEGFYLGASLDVGRRSKGDQAQLRESRLKDRLAWQRERGEGEGVSSAVPLSNLPSSSYDLFDQEDAWLDHE